MAELSTTSEERVRINLTTNAKGAAQKDITVEAGSPERAKALLEEAILAWDDVARKYGIPVAGAY